jgi:hypothetical protein
VDCPAGSLLGQNPAPRHHVRKSVLVECLGSSVIC